MINNKRYTVKAVYVANWTTDDTMIYLKRLYIRIPDCAKAVLSCKLLGPIFFFSNINISTFKILIKREQRDGTHLIANLQNNYFIFPTVYQNSLTDLPRKNSKKDPPWQTGTLDIRRQRDRCPQIRIVFLTLTRWHHRWNRKLNP